MVGPLVIAFALLLGVVFGISYLAVEATRAKVLREKGRHDLADLAERNFRQRSTTVATVTIFLLILLLISFAYLYSIARRVA